MAKESLGHGTMIRTPTKVPDFRTFSFSSTTKQSSAAASRRAE